MSMIIDEVWEEEEEAQRKKKKAAKKQKVKNSKTALALIEDY